MAFSTSSRLAHAWRYDDISPKTVAGMFACSAGEAKQRLATTRARLADPERTTELLRQLPVPALAVLALLAEHEGMLAEDDVYMLALERFALSESEVRAGLVAALKELLVVALKGNWQGTEFSLVEPAVDAVLAHVVDLDVPLLPDGALIARADHDDARALLATCMALGQIDVKLTQAGLPHRAAVKRLAKQVGSDEATLEAAITLGHTSKLLVCDDDEVLRPDLDRLRDAASGRYAHAPALATLAAHLAHNGPMAREAVARWWRRLPPAVRGALLVDHIGRLPGFVLGTIDGIEALGASTPAATAKATPTSAGTHPGTLAAAATAAATITPSFEVFLPPESSGVDVIDVLECAEIVRIDRVIVAKITKASVSRAAASGSDSDAVLSALSRACRTPLPQNVEVAIRDWCDEVTFATLAVGRVIAVPPRDEQRVRTALQAFEPRVIAPGVLVVHQMIHPRVIAASLAKIGVHERAAANLRSEHALAGPTASDDEHGASAHSHNGDRGRGRGRGASRGSGSTANARTSATTNGSHAPASPQLPPLPSRSGDPSLRARLAAYRRGDEAERELARVASPPPPANRAATSTDPLDESCLPVGDAAVDALEQWEHRRRCKLQDADFSAAALTMDVVSEQERRFLLAATSPKDLNARLMTVLARGGIAAVLTKHRDQIAPLLPTMQAMLEATGINEEQLVALTDRPTIADTPQAATLEWHRDNLLARLQAAARTHSTLVLDIGSRLARVAITRVLPRGSTWMILGDDVDDAESAVAFPLDAIQRVAEPALVAPPVTWQPAPGDRAPPGHAPCPCGSGQRYRNCCRKAN